jgi:hypothetical protein
MIAWRGTRQFAVSLGALRRKRGFAAGGVAVSFEVIGD